MTLAAMARARHFDGRRRNMAGVEPERIGFDSGARPHAHDPIVHPELFEGVLARRVIAFAIDVLVISIPVIFASMFILLFGLITLGLGWALFWLLPPASVVWALCYYGMTLGGPASATLGMRVVDLEMRTWYGAPCYFLLGAVHAIAFWVSLSALTPLVLAVGLLNGRRRLLHDLLLGTVVINNDRRAAALRHGGWHGFANGL
jgi:uncharacterized RDD family membrane protein YckC